MKRYFVFSILFIIFYNAQASESSLSKVLQKYTALTEEENPYAIYNPEKFGIDEIYAKRILRERNPVFHINEIDIHNISYNTNISLRFPFTFLPFGGVNMVFGNSSHYNSRGIDIGFLFRMETLLSGNMAFTALNSYTNTGSFITFTQIDFYPDIMKEKRFKLYTNLNVNTTAPQHYFLGGYHASEGNYLGRIFKRLKMDKTNYSRTGFSWGAGTEVTLPFYDITSDTALRLDYSYTDTILPSPFKIIYPTEVKEVKESNLTVNIMETLTFSLQKQEKILLTGNLLRVYLSGAFPVIKADNNFTPDLSMKISNVYTKKLFRDFSVKTRAIAGVNYNNRENLSGDGMVRGSARGSFTGLTYLMANLDLLIPLLNVDLYSAVDVQFKNKVNFAIFFALFFDGGVSISSDNLKINSLEYSYKSYLKDHRVYFDDGSHFLDYAFTAGAGIRVYPYFLHFIVRLDVGVNVLESIIYKKQPTIELTISFNDVF